MNERVVGAILAGGRSRRMGAAKAGVLLEGRPLSSRVADALFAVCDDVVVLGHGEGCPEALPRLEDPPGLEGPLAGLCALLESGLAPRYLVAACDMPLLAPAALSPLLEVQGDALAVCYRVEGRAELEPLPLLLSTDARPLLEARVSRGELRLMGFVSALAPRALPIDEREAARLANVNTPEALARLGASPR